MTAPNLEHGVLTYSWRSKEFPPNVVTKKGMGPATAPDSQSLCKRDYLRVTFAGSLMPTDGRALSCRFAVWRFRFWIYERGTRFPTSVGSRNPSISHRDRQLSMRRERGAVSHGIIFTNSFPPFFLFLFFPSFISVLFIIIPFFL